MKNIGTISGALSCCGRAYAQPEAIGVFINCFKRDGFLLDDWLRSRQPQTIGRELAPDLTPLQESKVTFS